MLTHAAVRHNQTGFSVLTTLLIGISVMVVLMGVFAATNVSSGTEALARYHGAQLQSFTQGCLDEALLRLRRQGTATTYALTGDSASCDVEIGASAQPNVWNITVTGMMDEGSNTSQSVYSVEVFRSHQSVRIRSRIQQ